MLRFGIFLFSAIVLASGAVVRPKFHIDTKSPDGICPEINNGYAVYFGDTEDCTIFYECDWGVPIKQYCPPGTSWSRRNHRCDTSEVDQCENAKRKENPRSVVGECPSHDGQFPVYLPDDEDCSIFYECSNGLPIELQCAPGDLFDAPSSKCVKATDAQCQGSSSTEKTAQKTKPKPKSAVGKCPNPSGPFPVYLPDNEDCSIFYECSNGQPIELQCAPGDLFDAPSGKCVKNTDAQCQGSSSAKTIQPYSPVGECPDHPGQYPVYLPDSDDCTVFYECDWGRPIKQHCPPGTSWSISYNRCDTSEVDQCENGKRKTNPRSAVGECPSHDGQFPVYLPDDEDCSVFYECSNGRPIKLQCAPGDLFDASQNKCVKDTDAQCQDSSSAKKTAEKTRPKPKSVVGECPSHDGQFPVYLPDDEDCSIFYECSNGLPIELQCAPGDLFDAPSGKCVKNTDAQCQGSSSTEKTAQKSKPKPKSAVGECPNPSGPVPVYLPDDQDCSAFYECSNGEAIKLHCAPGTLFDSVSRRCKSPEVAKCQNASK